MQQFFPPSENQSSVKRHINESIDFKQAYPTGSVKRGIKITRDEPLVPVPGVVENLGLVGVYEILQLHR